MLLQTGRNTFVYTLEKNVNFGAINYTQIIEGVEGGGMRNISLDDKKTEIREWGLDNSAPENREKLISSNEILPNLIILQRNLLIGGGVFCYKEQFDPLTKKKQVVEVDMPDNIKKFFDKTDIDSYFAHAANELTKHSVAYPEIIFTKGGQVSSISIKECRFVRAEKKETGVIKNFWFSGHWGLLRFENWRETAVLEKIAAYDPALTQNSRALAKQGKCIFQIADLIINDGYYPIPPLDGAREWIKIMNQTPAFHNANLNNSYSISYHIEIPEDYFFDMDAVDNGKLTREKMYDEAEDKYQRFIDDMNKFLAGAENSGRAIYTSIRQSLEKQWQGIKITPIKPEMRDKALLDLHDAATIALLSNQGVPAVLASIPTPNRLSAGAEIRNTLSMYLMMYTPYLRAQILKPLRYIGEVNKWDPNIKIGFRDIEMQTLDNNPAGKQEATAK